MLTVHLALILVSLLFGSGYIASKLAVAEIPPGAWAFIRAAATAIALTLLTWRPLIRGRFKRNDWFYLGLLGIFGVFLNQIFFMEGLSRTTPTHSALINAAIPVLTLLFAILLGRESASLNKIAGIVLSLTGVLVLLEVEKQNVVTSQLWGDVLCFLNSCCFAFYLVLAKNLNRKHPSLAVTTGTFIMGAALMIPYGAFQLRNVQWAMFTPNIILILIYVVICNTIIPYFLNNWAVGRVESSQVALYIYLQPLVAGAISRWLYEEKFTLRMGISALLILLGLIFGNLPRGRLKNN